MAWTKPRLASRLQNCRPTHSLPPPSRGCERVVVAVQDQIGRTAPDGDHLLHETEVVLLDATYVDSQGEHRCHRAVEGVAILLRGGEALGAGVGNVP